MRKLFYAVFALGLLLSCASPYTISRLTPDESDIAFWDQGRAFTSQGDEAYTVKIAFEESTQDHIIMNFEVYNFSDESIMIDPLDFSVQYEMDNGGRPVQRAVDPESTILDLEMAISRNWAQERNAQTSNAILAFSEVAASATALASGVDATPIYESSIDRQINHEGSMQNHANRHYNLHDQRAYYREAVLRKTSIFPGNFLAGKVVFPRIEASDAMVFRVPVEQRLFEFRFFHFAHRPIANVAQ
ncbi:hypothetical protein [Pararhodonellum marinum]|uniref:hypothetical protein n=1 Tax=Pararhodonellum marinum TaxID=2755358 RepID=UPI00188FC8F9|nr:hypothetical protein [Pararhodonellum marinum]